MVSIYYDDPRSYLASVKKKLVTHEDPLHFHKIFGILCLLSWGFRFSMVGETDMGFLTHPEWTLPTLFLHLSLFSSSFAFKIPKRRIQDGGGWRIWPEYRLHSAVFTLRHALCIAVAWYEVVTERQNQPLFWASSLIFYVNHILADIASWSVGKDYQSNTVRKIGSPALVRFFFSFAQVFSIPFGYLGMPRRASIHYYTIMLLQFTAFSMTIRRKNLAPHWFLVTVYFFNLVGGACILSYEVYTYTPGPNYILMGTLFGSIAVMLRLGPRWPGIKYVQNNKYVMWAIIGVTLNVLRPDFQTDKLPDAIDNEPALLVAVCFALIGVVATALHKHFQEAASAAPAIANKTMTQESKKVA